MAEAVAAVLATGGVLLAEAGTGTGKTLAYLVPAILSRKRVLVSTGTKNLQEQIFFKDLPVLREALGIPFTATCMKGRGNYLCLHRFEAFRETQRHPLLGRDAAHPHPRALARRDRDRRSRRSRGPARRPALLERHRRDDRELSRRRVSALQRLLRRQDAPARRRIRHRHRQPPPALCRRGRQAEQLRRSDPALQQRHRRRGAPARRRGDAVLRPLGQQLSRRRPRPRRRPRHRRAADHRRRAPRRRSMPTSAASATTRGGSSRRCRC